MAVRAAASGPAQASAGGLLQPERGHPLGPQQSGPPASGRADQQRPPTALHHDDAPLAAPSREAAEKALGGLVAGVSDPQTGWVAVLKCQQ